MAQRIIDPRIKLRHIACFLEVARLRSVVNAAETLNISQPAASKTIQELELFLGNTLFDRSRRKLVPTPFGEVFYRYASTSIAALRQGIDAARSDGEAATVKIGALPSVSARILPAAVREFTESEPGVHTRVITGPNNHLLSLLRTGDVDLVIGRMAEPEIMAGFSFEHLYSEQVAMVVRTGHGLLDVADFNMSLIEGFQMLMPTPDSVIRRHVDRAFLAHGVTHIRDEIETVSDAFARSYVRQTDAIWVISEGVVANDVAEGQLAMLPIDMSQTTGSVGFTRRTDSALTLAAQALMEAIRKVAAEL